MSCKHGTRLASCEKVRETHLPRKVRVHHLCPATKAVVILVVMCHFGKNRVNMVKTIVDPNPRIELLCFIDTAVRVFGLSESCLYKFEATAQCVNGADQIDAIAADGLAGRWPALEVHGRVCA